MPQVLFALKIMTKRLGRQLEDAEPHSFENRRCCNARAAAPTKHTQLTLNLSLLSLLCVLSYIAFLCSVLSLLFCDAFAAALVHVYYYK